MPIEDSGDDYIVYLRYRLLVGAAYAALGTLAIAAGVLGGSRFTMSHPQSDTLYPSVRKEAQPRVVGLENTVADGRPKSEYEPFVSLKIDNDFFAVVVEQTGNMRAGSTISGTGFGDVYDQKGRLVRRYAAVQDTNSSWELLEFMRLPAAKSK